MAFRRRPDEGRRGAALILALALLAVMAVMGTYYVRYMNLEQEAADLALGETRARLAAEAGVQATIGRLSAALRANALKVAITAPDRIEFPTYQLLRGERGLDLAPHQRRRAAADVAVFDENARLNLNCAPAPVIEAALGIAPDVARRIVSAAAAGQFLEPEDLVARGLLSQEEFERLDRSLVTTYSAPDPKQAHSYLNVNTALPKVLAAALGVTEEAARAAQDQGPYQSLDAFSQIAGKDVTGAASDATPLPARAFDCESRCFRVVSTGTFARVDDRGREYGRAVARLDAVVLFEGPNQYDIIHWSSGS
ncbi:MAG TPA: type II secretion system protein GspK [Candidatus Hydrogenedentes bacterium]|nr:type II secretion system protein GspK [Candidatus Hydrogenedentota bacterium]